MKAIRLTEVGRPLEAQEVPVPQPGPGDVLVEVRAAGICHSDVHYRNGTSPVHPLPLTLGHEVAGVVSAVGAEVTRVAPGDRVVLHYLITCGDCTYCASGHEQFCPDGLMLGHHTDGGFAEYVVVPERNALALPDEIGFPEGSTLMCASATAFHALRKSRLSSGESLAVFGIGGLGLSAIQLGRVLGALDVYAVDLDADKLKLAEGFGAVPISAARQDPAEAIRAATQGTGVDVAVEMVGLPVTMKQALRSLAPLGRLVLVGIAREGLEIDTYTEVLGPEAEVIGSNDHHLHELPTLIEFARRGALDLSRTVSRTIPLDAAAANEALDELEAFRGGVRTVIVP